MPEHEPMFSGLALFARLMATVLRPCEGHAGWILDPFCGACNHPDDPLFVHSCERGAQIPAWGPAERLRHGSMTPDLFEALRAYHAGNPSALDALLGEAWGERPKRGDPVGIVREIRPDGKVIVEGPFAPICLCPATSEYDPPCPQHGILGIGVTGR